MCCCNSCKRKKKRRYVALTQYRLLIFHEKISLFFFCFNFLCVYYCKQFLIDNHKKQHLLFLHIFYFTRFEMVVKKTKQNKKKKIVFLSFFNSQKIKTKKKKRTSLPPFQLPSVLCFPSTSAFLHSSPLLFHPLLNLFSGSFI